MYLPNDNFERMMNGNRRCNWKNMYKQGETHVLMADVPSFSRSKNQMMKSKLNDSSREGVMLL